MIDKTTDEPRPRVLPVPPELDGGGAERRLPSQKRAKERVERILGVAAALIGEKGSDAMKMSEVAERAGISIGSLYQYYPDKTSIIRTLAERYNAVGRACIADELAGAADATEFARAFECLIDIYHANFLAEPVMRDIWFGAQADKALRAFQLGESRLNGELVAATLLRLRPDSDPDDTRASALTVMHLGEEAMRLAISLERAEGDAVVAAYKRMALAELLRTERLL